MYTFQIDIGSFNEPVIGGGYIACNPLKDGVKFKKYREEEFFKVVRQKIDGKLKFYGSEYDALLTLLDQDEIYVPIKCYYNSVLKLTGILNLFGEWDKNKHICDLTISTEDQYSLLFKNLDYDFDIKLASSTTAKTNVYSQIITSESGCTTLSPSEMGTDLFGDDSVLWVYSSSYADNCTFPSVRHIYKSSIMRWAATGYTLSTITGLYHKATSVSELVRVSFTRFRKIVDCLNKIFDTIDPTISADETTISDYFTEDIEMKYLLIADKSDVKRYTSANEAAFEYISVEEFFKLYKSLSNLDWYIDEGVFKLEYPKTYQLPDLTLHPEHDFSATGYYLNCQKYKFDVKSKVNKEIWQFEKTNTSDFKEQSIIYDNLELQKASFGYSSLNMDFEYVAKNTEDVSDSGFVVVATTKSGSDYYIINKTGLIDPVSVINGKLMTTHIINDHMLEGDRPYPKGEFLNEEVSLISRGLKQVIYENVPIKDADLIDFDYSVKTEIGNVIPMEIEIDITEKEFTKFTGVIGQLAKPIVSTQAVTNITTNSITGNGTVVNDNGYAVTERGFVYSLISNPTTSDNKKISGSGEGVYTASITGLVQSTVYYLRAYAINEQGTGYGSEVTFTTLGNIPTITTAITTDITPLTALAGGNLIATGGNTVTQLGVCYSTNPNPTTLDNTETVTVALGEFTCNLTGLIPATKYYVRAYAISAAGTGYGSELDFTTGNTESIWTIMVNTPAIVDDETTLQCRVTNIAQITLIYSIYLNSTWLTDSEIIPIGTMRFVNFSIINPLGLSIPTGTPYKVDVVYNSVTYNKKTGTL